MSFTGDTFDRKTELKAFDDTKQGVKGLVDAGVTKVPKIFIQQPHDLSDHPQSNPKFNLPIINLNGFNSDPLRRTQIVNEIRSASQMWGFFQVINHDIPVSVLREMRDGALGFFDQDDDVKKKWYVSDSTKSIFYNSNVDLSSSLPVRWRDSFHCRMVPDPPNPQQLPQPCRDILIEYSKQVTKLGCSLFELLSEALGLASSHLNDIGCADGLATICHYYPASPQPELTIGARKHADNDFITILLQDHIGGLQFLHQNQWVDVPFVPEALVVNIGDLLQLISNDELISAEHRVISSSVGPRVSVACFFTTGTVDTGKIFEPIKELLSEQNPAKYRATTMKEFVQYSHSKTVPACQNLYKNSFTYHCLPDSPTLAFDDAVNFLEQCEKDKARVLAHCMSGKNRSPAVVMAFLMKSRRWTFDQSYKWVKERRPSVDLNPGVLQQLQEYVQKLQAAVEATGGALPPISDGGAPFSFGFTSATNVAPAFPAFNTTAAATSIFTRADIPPPNEFTFGAAVQTQNTPQNMASPGASSVNPNATDVSMDGS